MDQDSNIGGAFLAQAAAHPGRVAVMDEAIRITYGQLRDITIGTALHMQARGVAQGQTVALRSDDLAVIMATVFATALLGCRWVFGGPKVEATGVLRVDHFFQTDPVPEAAAGRIDRIDAAWARPPEGFDPSRPIRFPGYRDPEDIWMISQTSGTTGTPKYVGLSQRIVRDRCAANRHLFTAPGMGIVCLFPLSAPALLGRFTAALLHEATIVSSQDPAFWASANVGLVIGSPVQVDKFLGGVTLPAKLPMIHVSGGQLSDRLARHLFGSFDRVVNGYGATETNNTLANVKTLDPDGTIRTTTELRDVELEVVDENDRPVPPGVEGIVRVRNAYLAPGYIGAPEAEAAAFRGGWFYPGDAGMWTKAGVFVPTGRRNDQFNLGGVKINAMLLDFTLLNLPGVRDAMCFMMPRPGQEDRLTAFLSLHEDAIAPDVLASAKVALTRLAGREAVPERFLFAAELPRNANGKPDRRACIAMVESGKELRRSRGR